LKKIIAIVIIAALVLAAFTALAGNVKADTSEVTVITYSQYVAPSTATIAFAPGDLIVVGELRNIGANIIGNVTVQGTALSANGQTLAITSSQAFVYYMAPGQKAPFYLDFTAQSSQTQDLSWVPSVTHVLVTVTSVTNVNQRQYADAKVTYDINYTDASGLYVVRGTVENTGNLVAQQPWVVTTFYDASGTVVGLNFTNFLASSLSPNGGLLFFAVPADNDTQVTSKIKNYSFQVDSLTLTPSTSPSTSSTPTSSGSTSPTGQIPILPIIIVAVLVVVAAVALVLFRNRRKMPLPPPPPKE
jgi:hypothetical protein